VSEEWEETSLGECTNWASGGTPSKKNASFWVGDIPWVSAKDMKKFRLFDAQDQISTSAIGRGGKITPKGSILLLVRGMTLHNDVPICVTEREMAFNQDLKAIRPKGRLDGNYLAYWLLAKKPDLLATVDQAGHGTGRLVTDRLKEMRISIPPLSEQKRIAHILGTLDDKIELNRRMNATLESMARALFQSWFIDFDPVRRNAARLQNQPSPQPSPNGRGRSAAEGESASGFDSLFPESFQDSELGEVPKGWKVYPLSAKIQLLSGGTPKTSEEAYWGGDIPWYSVRDAPIETDVWVIQTDKSVTSCGIENSAAKVFPERTTIISARGTVGKLALTGVPMAMNQSCYGIRGAAGYGDYYTHYLIREATARLQQNRPRISIRYNHNKDFRSPRLHFP